MEAISAMPEFEDETHFYPLKNGDPHYEAIGRVASAWSYFEFHVNQEIWMLSALDDERGACVTSHIYNIAARITALLALLDLMDEDHPEPVQANGKPREYSFRDVITKLKRLSDKQIEPISRKRNRIIHDTWMYGKRTGAIAQIRATADRKLDYGFRPADLVEINATHKRILKLDREFVTLVSAIHATLRQLQIAIQPKRQT